MESIKSRSRAISESAMTSANPCFCPVSVPLGFKRFLCRRIRAEKATLQMLSPESSSFKVTFSRQKDEFTSISKLGPG